jgi:hypothetical protein
MALAWQVLLDETTRQRAGRGLDFDDVGRIKVRGRVGTTRIFALAPEIEAEALPVAAVAVACS